MSGTGHVGRGLGGHAGQPRLRGIVLRGDIIHALVVVLVAADVEVDAVLVEQLVEASNHTCGIVPT